MSPRVFRTPDSFYAEQLTRNLVPDLLRDRGFSNIKDKRKHYGNAESQTIYATTPDGKNAVIRVRLCWRRQNPEHTNAAAQIMPKVKGNDWEGTLKNKFQHEMSDGITHTLFIQRELDNSFSHAALIPQNSLLEVWCSQREASNSLLNANGGKIGRRTKNHTMNGASPTLWLFDEHAPEVNKALWDHPSVINLLNLDAIPLDASNGLDDTYDDLIGFDSSLLGNDGGEKIIVKKSCVKRDPKVRRSVILRAAGKCERMECGASRPYTGFLDVHHILGVEKSDRVYNCVALCPNCHREAHAAPDQEQINAVLLEYAMKFKPQSL